jgi:putative ABC transport system permease protein
MNDLRFALRLLGKSPGFAAVAILLLALGIGANTAFFTLFKANALAPFPYPQPDRVVQLWRTNSTELEANPWSMPDYLDIRDRCTSLDESGAYRPVRFTLGGEHPEPLQGVACSPGAIRALGMPPVLGRSFTNEDDQPGGLPVVILSYSCWVQRLGADPAIVGHAVRLDGQNYTVVGVMPANFEFYCPWTRTRPIDVWVPLRQNRDVTYRGSHGLLVVGRLKPGVSVAAANAELRVLSGQLEQAFPETNTRKWFFARPIGAEIAFSALFRYGLVVMPLVLVLVATSANVGIMFLARGAGRQTEFAVRLALGGSRWDLIRLAMTESFLLSLLGALVGWWFAWQTIETLPVLFPAFTTHAVPIQMDWSTLGWSLALAFATAFAAGVPPALTAARTEVSATINQGGPTVTGSRTRHRFLGQLVAGQIAIVLLLVNTAFLTLLSYRAALAANEPLSSEYVLAAQLTVKGERYAAAPARIALWTRFLERVRALPGVTSAGMTTKLPLRGGNNRSVLVDGESFDPKINRPNVELSWITADYFRAMGVPILHGRTLQLADASDPQGVVINRMLADHYWPGQDPLGKRIRGDNPGMDLIGVVVGVAEDVRQWDVGLPAQPEMYYLYDRNAAPEAFLVVRSALDAHGIVPSLRRELAALDPDLALAEPATMTEIVHAETAARRNLVRLMTLFMAATTAITALGVYGTLSFQTRQRTREIGVRLALGAAGRDIVALVLRQAVPWLVRGVLTGLVLSVGVALALQRFLADIKVVNPSYYLLGFVTVGLVLIVASWLPASRASRVNPVEALRSE